MSGLLKESSHRRLEDRLDWAWYWDRVAKAVIFIGGISAIIFVISIFVFIAKEGLGFALFDLDKSEFFGSPAWRPTSEPEPQFGALALIAGTASGTGFAMLGAVPFSLGAAIYISEFATGRKREFLKILVELLAAIPSVVWGFIGLTIMNPLIIEVFDIRKIIHRLLSKVFPSYNTATRQNESESPVHSIKAKQILGRLGFINLFFA